MPPEIIQADKRLIAVRPLAYNTTQAARALGVGPRTLHRMRDKWRVPYKQLGKRVVYPVKALEQWINQGFIETEAA